MPKASRIAVAQRMDAFHRDLLGGQAGDPGEGREEAMRAVAADALGLPPSVMATLDAEKRCRAAMKHWEAFQTWKAERNPARAALEARHGYDTKHAMHLVRLMRMGVEILERGELLVRRPDADELNAIRDGALSFDALETLAARLDAEMRQAAAASPLPAEIDRARVDALATALMTLSSD